MYNSVIHLGVIDDDVRVMDAHGWRESPRGCWIYTRSGMGYGTINRRPAHRVAYERWNGPIPEGHVIRHRCDNPPCINPNHLETGTTRDNYEDMVDRREPPNFRMFRPLGDVDIAYIHAEYARGKTSRDIHDESGIPRRIVRKHRPQRARVAVPGQGADDSSEWAESDIHAAYWRGLTPKEIRSLTGAPLQVIRGLRPDGYRWDLVSHLRGGHNE